MPIDILCAFAGVVLSIVAELRREAMEWTAVASCNKSLDHLLGKKVEGFVRCDVLAKHKPGLHQSVEFLGKSLFGYQSDTFVFEFAALEEEHRGDVADAEAGCQVAALVDIGGAYHGFAFIFSGNLLDTRGEGFAGATPSGTEINHDGHVRLHQFVEVLFCDFHIVFCFMLFK